MEKGKKEKINLMTGSYARGKITVTKPIIKSIY